MILPEVSPSEADIEAAAQFLGAVNEERRRRGHLTLPRRRRGRDTSYFKTLCRYFAAGLLLRDALSRLADAGPLDDIHPNRIAKIALGPEGLPLGWAGTEVVE